jgi:hypothetical protein
MRTTLRIDDDVLRAAKTLALMQEKSLGEVISGLVRKALAPQPQREADRGFPVFSVPEDAPPMTPDQVRRALEDD